MRGWPGHRPSCGRRCAALCPPPGWSKAGTSAGLEAASSSSRGSGWAPRGPASPWEYRAAQSRQARPEEAQEPSWGTGKGSTFDHAAPRRRGS
eukprot:scaffold22481_cov49-Phaeocystis_antarctica.AAC.1